jgi:hypothetical protein
VPREGNLDRCAEISVHMVMSYLLWSPGLSPDDDDDGCVLAGDVSAACGLIRLQGHTMMLLPAAALPHAGSWSRPFATR